MTHIKHRLDTEAQWASVNPVLLNGEFGWVRANRKGKMGDGITPWNDLPWFVESPAAIVTSVAGKTGAVSLVVGDVSGAAPLLSPAFGGTPTGPTQGSGDSSTRLATTAFVKNQGYAPLASPALTGTPTAPTQAVAANGTSIATTAFVKSQGYAPTVSPALTGAPTAPTQASGDNSTRIATTAFARTLALGNSAAAPAATATAASLNALHDTFTVMALARVAANDPSSMYASTGLYTVPVTGFYMLTAVIKLPTGAAGGVHRMVTAWVNGVEDARVAAPVASAGNLGVNVSYLRLLTAGTTVNFRIYQDSGSTLVISLAQTGVAFIRSA